MQGHLILTNCLTDEVTRPNIERALQANELLWLDLEGTDEEVLDLLRDTFKLHPLAIEDVQEFNQRPKIEDYDDFVSLVAYGARGLDDPLVEVHAFCAEHFLVSVHRDPVPSFSDACHALSRMPTDKHLVALYRLLDALVDSLFPYLSALDDRIDSLQDAMFARPEQEQLQALFSLKRKLVDLRKRITPQREMVSAMLGQVVAIPGMNADAERYMRDLYDHVIRIADQVDSYRDLIGGSLDAYMSLVSNRMNDVMKQLTIIATIFLPLSFLTGFFGQNFAWLVNRLGSGLTFFAVGLGTEVLAVILLLVMFRRLGWMGKDST